MIGIHSNTSSALPVTFASPVKRRYTPSFDDVDTENIDPTLLASPTKKAKNDAGYPVKPAKVSHFVLKQGDSVPTIGTRPTITPRRLENARSTRKTVGSNSAPAAAGRSPKSKRVGILSRRRVSSSPFTRVDPPSYGLTNGLPFSIDAALAATVPQAKAEPVISTLDESVPKGWLFDIHEDTPDEELGNLMQHSTQTLDISDDEERKAAKDDRGKENIPPVDNMSLAIAPITTTNRPVHRSDMMTDEPRTPLGDLEASEFYAAGCDASSFIIIPAEKNTDAPSEEQCAASEALQPASIEAPLAESIGQSKESWQDLFAQRGTFNEAKTAAEADAVPAEIEIWESESAKGEEQQASRHVSLEPLEDPVNETFDDVLAAAINASEDDYRL